MSDGGLRSEGVASYVWCVWAWPPSAPALLLVAAGTFAPLARSVPELELQGLQAALDEAFVFLARAPLQTALNDSLAFEDLPDFFS